MSRSPQSLIRKALVATAVGAASLGMMSAPVAAEEASIATIAAGNADFATLVAAASAADLVGTLADCDAGPFTVFAPTNAAFAAALAALGIDAGTLLADTATLTSILTYHVVPGKVMAADVVALTSANTLQGSALSISVVGGSVKLNGTTTVVATDIEACNGVIHVIDSVLLPSSLAGQLPSTGAESSTLAVLALVFLVGGTLIAVGVRRRPASI